MCNQRDNYLDSETQYLKPVLRHQAYTQASMPEGKLFEDPDFSPVKALPDISTDIKWLRPHQIVENPKLFSDGHSRFDVVQGVLTNCWLMAAMATLTTYDALFDRVVPPDQGFTKKEKYAGIFRFHFWQDGKWIEVIIDDRLPTQKGELVLTHSQEKREFWSALLEKAYAKLYGSYTVLNMGYTSEALRDMTGGLTETICWEPNENPPDNLIDIINTVENQPNVVFGYQRMRTKKTVFWWWP
uniref:Calpain catalytic domain-containing protein n=1 Tax=Acrobeloides nanus TaxID=290746 RepID=A0A914D5R2_9BILA